MCIPSCHLTESPDLSLNATLYHVVLPESSVQSAGTYIFTAGLSRPLRSGSERILSVALTGDGNFQIDLDTRVVTTSVASLQAGRYTFDISIAYVVTQPSGLYTLTASGIVDVVSQREYMYIYTMYMYVILCTVTASFFILHFNTAIDLFCIGFSTFVYTCTRDSRGFPILSPLPNVVVHMLAVGTLYVTKSNL